MKSIRAAAAIAFVGLALVSCSGENPSVIDVASESERSAASFTTFGGETVEFGGWEFVFVERKFDNEGNHTFFTYRATSITATEDLNHFALEMDECVSQVDHATPSGYIEGIDAISGLQSVIWFPGLDPQFNQNQVFSVKIAGDVPIGMIAVAVEVAQNSTVLSLPGPCEDIYSISGTVYIDADGSGTLNNGESGLPNVTATIDDGNGGVFTGLTDANGAYVILAPAGDYTVTIEAVTPAADFNEDLAASFDTTSATALPVSTGPDSADNNFGYEPRTTEIIEDLETGVLLTDGRSTKYWWAHNRAASKKKTDPDGSTSLGPKADYTAEELLAFLLTIEGLFLVDPYQFTAGAEFVEAAVILKKDPNATELEALKKELLAAELNRVAGIGLIGSAELFDALLSWAELVVFNEENGITPPPVSSGISRSKGGDDDGPQRAISRPVEDATILMRLLNGAVGGGSGGEG